MVLFYILQVFGPFYPKLTIIKCNLTPMTPTSHHAHGRKKEQKIIEKEPSTDCPWWRPRSGVRP